jgi:hypothetical protein
VIVAAIVIGFAVLLVHHARAKAVWHDEVYTILEAGMPVATLWRASIDGLDLSPPLSILTHVVRTVAGAGPVAARLVPIAALLVAVCAAVRDGAPPIESPDGDRGGPGPVSVRGMADARSEARAAGSLTVACAVAMFGWSEAAGRRLRRNWTLMAVAIAAGAWRTTTPC